MMQSGYKQRVRECPQLHYKHVSYLKRARKTASSTLYADVYKDVSIEDAVRRDACQKGVGQTEVISCFFSLLFQKLFLLINFFHFRYIFLNHSIVYELKIQIYVACLPPNVLRKIYQRNYTVKQIHQPTFDYLRGIANNFQLHVSSSCFFVVIP